MMPYDPEYHILYPFGDEAVKAAEAVEPPKKPAHCWACGRFVALEYGGTYHCKKCDVKFMPYVTTRNIFTNVRSDYVDHATGNHYL
jgi:hypothetical protein